MKTLVIRNAFVHDFGGAERLSVHLAYELIKKGVAAEIVSRQPRVLDYAESVGVRAHKGWWWSRQNWSGKGVVLLPLYLVWQLVLIFWYLQLLFRVRPSVVHIMSKDDFIAATFASRITGRRVVWTDTADLKYVFANHNIWYKNPVGKLVFLASRLAGQVGVVSKSEMELIGHSLGKKCPKNYKVVYIAGRAESVTPIGRTRADKNAVIFCATSRLVTAKGIGELIEAFNNMTKKSNSFRLWLVGDGPEQDKFKQQAKDNPNILFMGHVGNPLEYVAACDVFVQPTYHEAFSLSLTEAAMLGKPMIATQVGGNPELVTAKNGLLVPARDSSALRDAMLKLANDESAREAMGRNARQDYVNKFDFSSIVKKEIIPLYEQITKN